MGLESLDAPEFKYTDRHVREDPDLRTWAEAYTRSYGGSFDPMLQAKRELRLDGKLQTRTARVVLNCARYDSNFANQLPTPKPPTLELIKTIKEVPGFCADPRPHYRHSAYEGEGRSRKWLECKGVPWEINREAFETDVVVKAGFAAAAASNIYHATSGEGWARWHPPMHAMGPAVLSEIVIDLVCKYPSHLISPMLFHEEPTDLFSAIKRKPGLRTRCPNGCFS